VESGAHNRAVLMESITMQVSSCL